MDFEIVDMRLGFIITDKTHEIKDALDKKLLRMGDWFGYKEDVYRLVGYCTNNDGTDMSAYIGFKLNEERIKREGKLVIYEGDGHMFETTKYYFDKTDKIGLVEFDS